MDVSAPARQMKRLRRCGPGSTASCARVGPNVSEVLQALRGARFQSQVRHNVMMDGSAEAPPRLGLSLGLNLAYCRGVGVSRLTQANEHVARLLCSFLRAAMPEFCFTSIQVNKDHASALHVDASNLGPSLIIGLGDYSGGELYVHGVGKCDIQGKWYSFDGNVPHLTCPFEGERYSVVCFTHHSYGKASAEEVDYLCDLGFKWPPASLARPRYERKALRLRAAAETLPPELRDSICTRTLQPKKIVSSSRSVEFDKRFEENLQALENWVRTHDGTLPSCALAVRASGGLEFALARFLNRVQKEILRDARGTLSSARLQRFSEMPELAAQLSRWQQHAAKKRERT